MNLFTLKLSILSVAGTQEQVVCLFRVCLMDRKVPSAETLRLVVTPHAMRCVLLAADRCTYVDAVDIALHP